MRLTDEALQEIRERVDSDYKHIPQPDWSFRQGDAMKLLDHCTALEEELRALPLCGVHQRLDDSDRLEVQIGGNNCVACSLNERAALLEMIAPFAAPDGSKDSLRVLQSIITAQDQAVRAAAQEIVAEIEAEREPYPDWSKNARQKYRDMAAAIITKHLIHQRS